MLASRSKGACDMDNEHVLPPHPSGFNKHIGKWHHHPTYRFTSVYRQNGNQIVIVVVLQCFSLKEDKLDLLKIMM